RFVVAIIVGHLASAGVSRLKPTNPPMRGCLLAQASKPPRGLLAIKTHYSILNRVGPLMTPHRPRQ
ncbi:MAG: hypothetical protein PHG75_00640, partial [Syntrophomonas sp.]|nr:hypothetical protein [Syntrophomonas sp.]